MKDMQAFVRWVEAPRSAGQAESHLGWWIIGYFSMMPKRSKVVCHLWGLGPWQNGARRKFSERREHLLLPLL